MATFTALFDACVFYPAPVRDLLLRLAETELFRARWTAEIHDEWSRNLLGNRKDLDAAKLHRTIELINQSVPDCLVTEYKLIEAGLTLPDVNDKHVLAAAIRCNAGVIVTYNLKDFPSGELEKYGIEAQHPDEFILHLHSLDPHAVFAAAKRQRLALRNPPMEIELFLNNFLKCELAGTVAELQQAVELL